MQTGEAEIRVALGIPQDAERVLIFAESSHWDPDWLFTSEEYYERFVQGNLDKALDELTREPRRVYSVECMFFLRMYWERRPERREEVRRMVNAGRLRLTSSGVTTADTIVPGPEALLRDFLLGQEWLRTQGMTQEPDLAYFPDSFGSSPALPSLLQAAGFSRTAVTRIDGMYFLGLEPNNPRRYPRPGSSAELLLKKERSLDFVWRDHAGAEVLAHWNAFTYGQGDLLAHRGVSRIYLFPFSIPTRSGRHLARKIKHYDAQLAPLSRTPYMFCPIGFDFVPPIEGLVELLDHYNTVYYPRTGIWALNAGLDDYLDLIAYYRDELPVLELDPNPYWTGFYTTRPALKARCHSLVDKLTLAESLTIPNGSGPPAAETLESLASAGWTAAVSNHHDFITGTSPDRVVYGEQIPWLGQAEDRVEKAIAELSASINPAPVESANRPLPKWSRSDGRIEIRSAHLLLELDEARGGAIVRAQNAQTGQSLLPGLGNDLVRFRVSGGLWRMGYEFRGGRWKESGRASDTRVDLVVHEAPHRLEVRWVSGFDGEVFERELWIYDDDPRLYFRIVGRAGRRRTIIARFDTGLDAGEMLMDQSGGIITRPPVKVYSPTFWPFQHVVHVQDRHNSRGLALYQRWPGAAALSPEGELSVVAFRNAAIERAYGLLPLSGNPARGYEEEPFVFDYAIEFTENGGWRDNRLGQLAYRSFHVPDRNSRHEALKHRMNALVELNRSDVFLLAYKPAARGAGRILRLYAPEAPGGVVSLRLKEEAIRSASLCDARERDLRPLAVAHGAVEFELPGTLATLRLQT